jgi:hypothetical protein
MQRQSKPFVSTLLDGSHNVLIRDVPSFLQQQNYSQLNPFKPIFKVKEKYLRYRLQKTDHPSSVIIADKDREEEEVEDSSIIKRPVRDKSSPIRVKKSSFLVKKISSIAAPIAQTYPIEGDQDQTTIRAKGLEDELPPRGKTGKRRGFLTKRKY